MTIDQVMKCSNKPELEELLKLFGAELKAGMIEVEQKELETRLIRANMERTESYMRMAQLQLDRLNAEQK